MMSFSTAQPDPSSKLLELANALLARTQAGSIAWRRSADPSKYVYGSDTGAVSIESHLGIGPTVMRVYDDAGREIDSLRSSPYVVQNALVLSDLFKAAQASATRSDEVIDRMLRDLG